MRPYPRNGNKWMEADGHNAAQASLHNVGFGREAMRVVVDDRPRIIPSQGSVLRAWVRYWILKWRGGGSNGK